jgi:8-oxo-dGTP pyrophosphatase MutT (NUDIX family)
VTLAGEEHHDIRWCANEDLDTLQPPMSNAVKWYCRKALEEIPDRKNPASGPN